MEGMCRLCWKSPATDRDGKCITCSMQDSLPGVSAPPTGEYRACGGCGYQVHNSIVTCGCGYAELGLVQMPAPTLPPAPQHTETASNLPNPYWTCQCGYEYNMQNKCTKCQCEKPAPAAQPNSYWTCQCGQGYNEQDKCAYCGAEKYPQAPAPPTQQPNPYWKCETCNYEYNTKDFCESCAYYAQSQKQEAEAAAYWTCQTCGYAYNQYDACYQCSQASNPPGTSSTTYSSQADPLQPVDQTTYSDLSQTDPSQYQYAQAANGDTSAYQQPPTDVQAGWSGQPVQAPNTPSVYGDQPVPYSQGQQYEQPADASPQVNPGNEPQTFCCPACGSPFNPCDGCVTCKSRTASQPAPPPSQPVPPSAQPEEQKAEKKVQWKCFECGNYSNNHFTVCQNCGTSRRFDLFLEKHSMKVSADRKSWICECKQPNALMSEVCVKCSRINVLAKAGKKGQGASIGAFVSNFRKPKK